MIGAARVLHRRDEPAPVAVRTGVAGGVPDQESQVAGIGRTTLLLLAGAAVDQRADGVPAVRPLHK